jgi:N-acetyl-beta-hexosaminidase
MKKVEEIAEIRDNWPYLSKPKRQRLTEEFSNKQKWPEGKKVILTITPMYRQRTIQQNSYMHGYLFPRCREGFIGKGWNPDEVTNTVVKEYLKKRFLSVEIANEETGEVMSRIRDTSELTTIEMSEFWDQCIQFAAEDLHIVVFLPGEQTEFDFERFHKLNNEEMQSE